MVFISAQPFIHLRYCGYRCSYSVLATITHTKFNLLIVNIIIRQLLGGSMAEDQDKDEDENPIQYQFTVDRALWTEWKDTVPRSKALDKRIIELVKEDLEANR
jgi:hypothetical protein